MTETPTHHAPVFRTGVLSVLIPVFNEKAYLRRCVERVLAVELPRALQKELVIVDDASTDGTDRVIRELAERHPDTVRAFRQPVNQGKGAAIRRAMAEMTGQYAIIQDGDLEYDPSDYVTACSRCWTVSADVVYGSRFAVAHDATGTVLSPHYRQQDPDPPLELHHRAQPDGHGDLLQGLSGRRAQDHSASARTVSGSSPKSRRKSPSAAAPSMKSRSTTAGGAMRKARRSAGKTACRRFTRF